MTVIAAQTGGAGGYGYNGAVGGNGADSTLTNVVSGSTVSGQTLTLTQNASGGAAGGTDSGPAGVAGNATSALTATNPGGGDLVGNSNAYGGMGGNSTSGTSSSGGTSTATINLSGSSNVQSNATACGVCALTGPVAAVGDALAIATGSASNSASVSAYAAAGHGPWSTLVGGATRARATGIAPSGGVSSKAETSGGLLGALLTSSSANVGSTDVSESRAGVGTPVPNFCEASGLQAVAFATGMPSNADATQAVNGNPVVASNFDIGGTSTMLGLVTLGGSDSSQSSSQATFAVNVSSFSGQDVKVGLINPVSVGNGFSQLHFQLGTQSSGTIVDKTFTSIAEALDYFDDNIIDLGAASSLGTGNNLGMSVTVVSSPGNSFYGSMLIGTANSGTPTPTPTPTPATIIQVTIQTNQPGVSFTVDGCNTYNSTKKFFWIAGSNHTISTTTPQSGGTGIQYLWTKWSDNGAISHTVAPTTNKTYTATFTKQYFLTMSAGAGGKVSPMSGWKNAGATVSLTATPTNNTMVSYSFTGWTGTGTGSFTGTTNPVSIVMGGPISETASFVQNPVQVKVQTNIAGPTFMVDDTSYTSTQTFSWQPGSSHTIATTSPQNGATGVRYVWTKWSDSGAISHTVSPTQNATYTATFTTQYFLTMSAGTGGKVTPASGWKNSGSAVKITATPSTGFTFSGWTGTGTGSFSGTTNPASITMGGRISETAAFTH